MKLLQDAMVFAHEAHAGQLRTGSNEPYIVHPAEVAEIVLSLGRWYDVGLDVVGAVAWLHDVYDNKNVTPAVLRARFGDVITHGVDLLSDSTKGTRKERKAADRLKMTTAPGWVVDIRVADVFSNVSSVAKNNPKFARSTYLDEKSLMLDAVAFNADPALIARTRGAIEQAWKDLDVLDDVKDSKASVARKIYPR